MAIQLRRGDYTDFDPSQLLDGELAIVLENDPNTDDGTGTYISYGDNNVKRLLHADESVEVPIATTTTAGIVKPDGETITVDEDGTIHGSSTISPSDTAPVMDGSTASAGSSDDYARGDHRHPTDTSRASASDLTSHTGNGDIHVSTSDRTAWNNKADRTDLTTHTVNGNIHVTLTDKAAWNAKADASDLTDHVDDTTVHITSAERTAWNGKADESALTAHTGSTSIHVTTSDKARWNGKADNAPATSSTIGLVKPDGTSTTVDADGTFHATAGTPATENTPGIVKPDNQTVFVDNGVLSAGRAGEGVDGWPGIVQPDGETLTIGDDNILRVPYASSGQYGVVMPDGDTTKVDGNGYLYVPVADSSYPGIVKPDGETTTVDSNGVLSVIGVGGIPEPSSVIPQMDGMGGSPGSSDAYARGDHVHPTDTSRMAASLKGAANGVAELDASGKVPSSQLPSYVDDVLEYSSQSALPATGETGKIYVTTDTNTTYRWSGSAYVPVSNPLDYATQAEAEAGTENTHVMTALRTKQAIDENAYTLPPATTETLGGVKPDGTTITVDQDGTIHAVTAAEIATSLATLEDDVADLSASMADLTDVVAYHDERIERNASDIASMRKSLLRRESDGYYDNQSVTAFLSAKFDGRLYGYSEPKTTATEVTKTGANAGIPNPTLGTATVAGTSEYRDLGPFQWFAAKGYVDADGVPHVKTIRGIDSDADWDACTDNVWSLRPVVWYSVDESGSSVIGSLSDTWHLGLSPNPQAYLPDGTLRPYMLAARYALGFENGVGVSKSGLKGYGRDVSHDSLITKLGYASSGYSGKSIYEQWYDVFMSRMIYGTKDFQTIMQGCTNYGYQYNPAVAETGVKRVILTNAQAAGLLVGSTMMLGTRVGASSNDRNQANNFDVFDGARITAIEEYDANNKAVYFDVDETFDTDPTYLLSTAPWHSGSCDAMDWDGSPTSPQSAKEVAFFQGCELMHGATEILAGVIISNDGVTGWTPYVVHDTRDDATSLTEDFVSCGAALPTNDSDSWKYPLYVSDHGGLMYGTTTGGSSTTGASDGHYTNKLATTGAREWLSSGYLTGGRHAGPSCVYGTYTLGLSSWIIWSRLSGTGRSRG